MLPSIKGNLRLLWELHTKFPGFNRSLNTKWKSPPNECLVSAGLKCLELGVALVNNVLFALLNYKRLRTDNLWILRDMQEKIRLSQVLTLFYSRIPEQNFLFDMINDCLFESKLHLLNKPSALCKLSFVLWMTGCRKPKKISNKPQSRCYDYHTYVWQIIVL